MVFFNHGFHIVQIFRKLHIHILTVTQQILSIIKDTELSIL